MNEGIAAEAAMNRIPQACREKYWEECTPEQKLDRLRDAMARVCRETSVLAQAIQRLAAHQHSEGGGLVVPIHFADPSANQASSALAGGLYTGDNGIPYNLRTERERR